MTSDNQHHILAELVASRVPSCLRHAAGEHCDTKTALDHACTEPSIQKVFHSLPTSRSATLGDSQHHILYDAVQRAIVAAFQDCDPPVVLAFRNSKQQAEHKLKDVSQPIGAITAFGRAYMCTPKTNNRLFLHLAAAPASSPIDEEWASSVLDAMKIESSDRHELDKAIAAADRLAGHSSTLARLCELAKQQVEALPTEMPLAKRQRVDKGDSFGQTTTLVLAPEGGSLSQDQADTLVRLGEGAVVTELAKLPPETSAGLYHDLVSAGPAGRKKLANKITTKFADFSWKVNAGVGEGIVKYQIEKETKRRIAELEKEREEEERRQQKKDEDALAQEEEEREKRIAALPWLQRFSKPIAASEWDAPLLHAWSKHEPGIELLVGIEEAKLLAQTCQHPRLVGLVAVLKAYSHPQAAHPGDGYIGEFEHPSGEIIRIAVENRMLASFDGYVAILKDTRPRFASLPRLPAVLPHQRPWLVDPTPMRPKDLTGGGPFVKYLLACDAASKPLPPHRYNLAVADSEHLKLAGASILYSSLDSRYKSFCTNHALDFEKDDLSSENLLKHGIVVYTRCKDGRECVTGFAEAPPIYIEESTTPVLHV